MTHSTMPLTKLGERCTGMFQCRLSGGGRNLVMCRKDIYGQKDLFNSLSHRERRLQTADRKMVQKSREQPLALLASAGDCATDQTRLRRWTLCIALMENVHL